MRILPLLILSAILVLQNRNADHPHGPGFKVSCNVCHSPKGWHLDKEIYSFDHNATKLPLVGQHNEVDCRQCHSSLIFRDAKTECRDCHNDVHQATVGQECSRCHSPASWLVSNITELHLLSRFPLLGAHWVADCKDCHKSESLVRFDVLGVNCIDCHRENYEATTQPDHIQAGFSESCINCHSINAFQWGGAGFNHGFFPLTGGHSQTACADCHTGGNYTSLSKECFSCHQTDYNNSANPKHSELGFPVNCELCHTTDPGWKPASYKEHDSKSFPIYSGKHNGEWNACTDCHTISSNWSAFSCLNCHEHNKTSMDKEHSGEGGYSYDSASCYRCHPRGTADD
jgi:hypothetical protein